MIAEYMESIATETMVREGPDLFIFDQDFGGELPNILKIVNAGAFADINKIIEKDKNFNHNDYLESTLKGCEFDGKQYLFPIGISSPFYFSSECALDEMGFDVKNAIQVLGFSMKLISILATDLSQTHAE